MVCVCVYFFFLLRGRYISRRQLGMKGWDGMAEGVVLRVEFE